MAGKAQRLAGRVRSLRGQGKSINDIALSLGISRRSITRIIKATGSVSNTKLVDNTPPDAPTLPPSGGLPVMYGNGNSCEAGSRVGEGGLGVAAPGSASDTDRAHLALVRRLRRSIASVVREGVGADGRTSPASAANALVSAVDRIITLERRLEGRPLDGSPAGQAGGQPIILLPARATARAFAELLDAYRGGGSVTVDPAKRVRE